MHKKKQVTPERPDPQSRRSNAGHVRNVRGDGGAPANDSERRFRALIENSSDGIALLSMEGAILYASPAVQRILGFTAAELLERNAFDLIHPEDLAAARSLLADLLAEPGTSHRFQCRDRHRDGSWIWVESTLTNLLDEPSVRAIVSNFRDVTMYRQTQAALAHALRERENIMETIPDVLYTLDREGRLIGWNRKLEAVSGLSADEIRGRSALDFFPEEDRLDVATAIRAVFTQGYAEVEARMQHRDGSTVSYHYTGVPLNDEHGAIIGMTGVGRDITERRRAEVALRQSEERFRSLIENASDLIAILDRDGTIHYASPSHERVAGWAPADLVGKNIGEFVHPHDQARLAAAFANLINDHRAVASMDCRFRHRDGSWRTIEGIGKNFLDDPIIAGVVVNAHDISDRREAEEALAAEAAVFHALAQVGRELISSLDRPTLLDRLCQVTTEVLGCDTSHTLLFRPEDDMSAAVAGYGYTPEEWEWMRVLKTPRLMVTRYMGPLQTADVMQRTLPDRPEDPIVVLASRLRWTVVLCMALRRGDELIGTLVACRRERRHPFSPTQERIGRGIAQLASMALENSRLVDELARASRLKSDFVATMSHELRTPLNVIMGYTELILDGVFGGLSSGQRESLERVHSSSGELLELINDTLNLSRLESGRTPTDIETVRLDQLIGEVNRETSELQRRSHLAFVWNVADNLPAVATDRTKVKVILKNLLGNAVKFTETGTVRIDARPCDDGVEIAVADTGIGMSPDVLTIIFEPFRQADSSFTRAYGGVGLGLYIVRQLIDLIGGTIAVDSEVGRGSTFRMWLPASRGGD